MTQTSLWQEQQQSANYAELCNALYERELRQLANMALPNAQAVQGRLKSLSYYINRTALLMTQTDSPLELDVQNAAWQTRQSNKIPLTGQNVELVYTWYLSTKLPLGLIVPVLSNDHIILDCIDRLDSENHRFRTNVSGWFDLSGNDNKSHQQVKLLKPNKKVMAAACSGHSWQGSNKSHPIIPSLRELLLSCSINWKNFKQPLVI
ncbi:MAG: hypothetical protein MJK12_11790 [Colwellia sp.]|nr:hypothetical protein [Colwellia sp.]